MEAAVVVDAPENEGRSVAVIDAIKTRTSYTTVLSILGLGGVLAMSALVQ